MGCSGTLPISGPPPQVIHCRCVQNGHIDYCFGYDVDEDLHLWDDRGEYKWFIGKRRGPLPPRPNFPRAQYRVTKAALRLQINVLDKLIIAVRKAGRMLEGF